MAYLCQVDFLLAVAVIESLGEKMEIQKEMRVTVSNWNSRLEESCSVPQIHTSSICNCVSFFFKEQSESIFLSIYM